jgi:hypothetical protein
MRKKLNGQHNQCPTCGEYFRSNSSFDDHRTGAFGKDRRCLTTAEMVAEGMILGPTGFWKGKPHSKDGRDNPVWSATRSADMGT